MSDDTTARGALSALLAAYDGPAAGVRGETPVIGLVGQDVPIELVEASGARALRLRGNPEWDLSEAERYLGTGLDPAVASIFAGILAGRYGTLDAIAVSSDCDASQRIFYLMRELRRVDPSSQIPPVHLVDVLHLPRESTLRYNVVRLSEFTTKLREWTGAALDDDAIASAVTENNRVRALQRDVVALRHAVPARLTGSETLAVLGARTRLDRDRYALLLTALLAGADTLPRHEGQRVFLSGSNHDSVGVYEALESRGALIVGDDNDWAELPTELDIDGTDIVAIARRYRDNGPTPQRASIAARAEHTAAGAQKSAADAIVVYSRIKDEGPLWDIPAQRSAAPVRFATALRQKYGTIDGRIADEVLAHDRQENAS